MIDAPDPRDQTEDVPRAEVTDAVETLRRLAERKPHVALAEIRVLVEEYIEPGLSEQRAGEAASIPLLELDHAPLHPPENWIQAIYALEWGFHVRRRYSLNNASVLDLILASPEWIAERNAAVLSFEPVRFRLPAESCIPSARDAAVVAQTLACLGTGLLNGYASTCATLVDTESDWRARFGAAGGDTGALPVAEPAAPSVRQVLGLAPLELPPGPGDDADADG